MERFETWEKPLLRMAAAFSYRHSYKSIRWFQCRPHWKDICVINPQHFTVFCLWQAQRGIMLLSVLSVGGCLFADSIKACIFWQTPVYFCKHLIFLQSHLSSPCLDSISIRLWEEKPQTSHSLPTQTTAELLNSPSTPVAHSLVLLSESVGSVMLHSALAFHPLLAGASLSLAEFGAKDREMMPRFVCKTHR